MRFDKVILAGSVLPKEFDWTSICSSDNILRQVQGVWNHRAQKDVPVGVLCAALRGLGMTDVGTAGYDGFEPIPEVHECFYYHGGHGAPLENLPWLLNPITGQEGTMQRCAELGWFSRISGISVVLPYVVVLAVAFSSLLLGPTVAQWVGHGHTALWGAGITASVLVAVISVFLYFL
jgi:hypothetical protein